MESIRELYNRAANEKTSHLIEFIESSSDSRLRNGPITVEMEFVTAEQAAKYLERNDDNRPIRSMTVDRYARDMKAGKWQLTHQGIAFDKDGNLIDGQHRLSAQAIAGVDLFWYVARLSSNTSAMKTILDQSTARRATDILKCRRKDTETARAIYLCAYSHRNPTIQEIGDVIDRNSDIIEATTVAAGTCVKTRSCAGVRAGFAMAMFTDMDRTKELSEQLYAFVNLHLNDMWPVVVGMVNVCERNPKMSAQWYATRFYAALDPSNKRKSSVKATDKHVDAVRMIARKMIGVE